MKMNKKGFTLIEMLVVIAIIAILVAIVIPVVSNSTMKATAATNAANLRSFKAELTIDYLDNNNIDNTDIAKPMIKACAGLTSDTEAEYTEVDGVITVTAGGYDIAYFAEIAETGSVPSGS